MKWFQKILFGLLIASFPLTMYMFATTRSSAGRVNEASPSVSWLNRIRGNTNQRAIDTAKLDSKLMDRAVNGKIREIAEIDVKVLEAEADLIKYKEQKQDVIKNLEELRDRIVPIIEQSKGIAKNSADNQTTE